MQFRILEYYKRRCCFVDVYNQMGGVVKAKGRYKYSAHLQKAVKENES